MKIQCDYCGMVFNKPLQRIEQSRHHYCSQRCHYKHRSEIGRVSLTCEECGQEFTRQQEHAKEKARLGQHVFCSRRCSANYHRRGDVNNQHGYKIVGNTHHPLANGTGCVFEHWLVLYEAADNPQGIVRLKKNGWTIHHKNGKRDDNRLSNLELRAPGRHGRGWTVQQMAESLCDLGWTVRPPEQGQLRVAAD